MESFQKPSITRAEIAQQLGIGISTVEDAKTVERAAIPEILDLVKNQKKLGLRAAANYVNHTPKEQQVADPIAIRKYHRNTVLHGRPAKRDAAPNIQRKSRKPDKARRVQEIIESCHAEIGVRLVVARDLATKLLPLADAVRDQSRRHHAFVSFTKLALIAGQLKHIVKELGGATRPQKPNGPASAVVEKGPVTEGDDYEPDIRYRS